MNSILRTNYVFITNNTLLLEEHTHNYWEIFIVIKGSSKQTINNTQLILEQNNMMLIRPNDIHKFSIVEGKNSYLNITIDPNLMREIFYFLSLNISDVEALPSPPICDFDKSFQNIFTTLRQLNIATGNMHKKSLTLKIVIAQFIHHILIEQSDKQYDSSIPGWFRDFVELLNKEESFCLTIEQICAERGFNTKLANKYFKQYFNTTANEYLIKKKLNYAANLLISSDLDILSISEIVGYHSLSHFIKIFKSTFGSSPSQYRKMKFSSEVIKAN